MKTILLSGFTESECEMHTAVFTALYPQSTFIRASVCEYGSTLPKDAGALINCMYSESSALSEVKYCLSRDMSVTLYSERLPTILFLLLVQKEARCSLLFCPNRTDIKLCAESLANGSRFLTRAAMTEHAQDELSRLLDYNALTETEQTLLYALAEGLPTKEAADILGKSTHYTDICISRLKEKFSVLEKRELLYAATEWMRFGAEAALASG